MNNDWKNYLLSKGAQLTDNAAFQFNDYAADNLKIDNSNILCDLSQFNTLVIAGDDAKKFMQGQFTNDVELVNENNSQLNAFCNNKGRMIANFRLFKHQQNYFFSVKNNLVEISIQHLQNYILRAQVAIQDVSEQLIHLGISGDDVEKLLLPFIEITNREVDGISSNENYIAIRIVSLHENKQPRYEIFCSFEHAKTLWDALSTQIEVISSSSWDYLNVQVGLPFIDINTSGEFVPQMVNMDLINGVSFNKGCFTGQEIVARMHYLGTLKRRTYLIKIKTSEQPTAGSLLRTDTSAKNQFIGRLINSSKTNENEYIALAAIQIKSADTEKLFLTHDNAEITLLKLPYSLSEISN
ncbi:tRNA-modifying protein YgfZ [hydrothermal vent metagenome]|uniref:tRNA-modifying protein YgfZ n=1 Tax=hydrothermal vent metagenome TaxID=652676 RepID=A0A3B0WEU7_9ZZZZ